MREEIEQTLSLIRLLADGELHSGQELAACLRISRAAVWKRVEKLTALGIEVSRIRSHGYHIGAPMELLDEEIIRRSCASDDGARCRIEIMPLVDSTNRLMLERIRRGESSPWNVIIAECQSSGRGRRGRTWVSPFGRNLYLSMHWRFSGGVSGLAGLSLVLGLTIAEMLRATCGIDATLKWPNDVQIRGAKVAGVLVEVEGDLSGDVDVVIGIGLNVTMPPAAARELEQPWTDVATHAIRPVSRNSLAARLLDGLVANVMEFDREGFLPFRERWNALDAFAGREAEVSGAGTRIRGVVAGVDETGCLRLDCGGRLKTIASGEVSLRPPA